MNNIKEVIKKSGLRQKFICEKLGINESQLSHIINERRKPNQKTIAGLRKILNVPVVELFPNAKREFYWKL
tara:strand:- start:660 stop:872 length:213 start_codon:yes stop_codon:yes gene_type:complete